MHICFFLYNSIINILLRCECIQIHTFHFCFSRTFLVSYKIRMSLELLSPYFNNLFSSSCYMFFFSCSWFFSFLQAVGNVHPRDPDQIRWWNMHFVWRLLSSYFPCSLSHSQFFTAPDGRGLPSSLLQINLRAHKCTSYYIAAYALMYVHAIRTDVIRLKYALTSIIPTLNTK